MSSSMSNALNIILFGVYVVCWLVIIPSPNNNDDNDNDDNDE